MNKLNQALVLALIIQTAILVAVNLGSDEPAIRAPSKVFDGFDPGKVTKISVHGEIGVRDDATADKQKTVKLEKSGASWGVADADGYPVDEEKVKTFLDNLKKLSARGPVVTRKAYFSKLEVADDKYQRKVDLTHDGKELVFYLGSSPSFKKLHLRKGDSEQVLLVSGMSAFDVGTSGRDWVNATYFKVPENDVWAVALANDKRTLRMEKGGPNDEWAVFGLKPGQTQKKTAVDDLIRKAASINLERPVGKTLKPEYGLTPPASTVTLVTGTSTITGVPPQSTATKSIQIGKKDGDTNNYFIKADTSDYVVTAPSWAIDPLLTKSLDDLVDK